MDKPLIVFEGVDNSGKTTISKLLLEKHNDFIWTKEPVFSTETADLLNSPESTLSEAQREVLFLRSRLQRQSVYRANACVLDRYLWAGLAYAKAFSPSIYNFCEALYQDYEIFKRPTVTIFMETPLETCQKREPSLTMERLTRIRNAYRDTEKFVNTPIEYIDGTKSIEECVEACEAILEKYARQYTVK